MRSPSLVLFISVGLAAVLFTVAGCGSSQKTAGQGVGGQEAGGAAEVPRLQDAGEEPGAAHEAAQDAAKGGGAPASSERERAIAAALKVYKEKKAEGVDFSNGPCIAQEVIPGWAVDVAHDPRQPVDDDPANQCASYREGRTQHFVELDPDGNLIRAQ